MLITAKYNPREKYDLAFVACGSCEGFIGQEIKKLGYPTYGLNLTTNIYDLRLLPKLVQLLKSYKPDIVHFYFKISFLGRIAARLAGVPIIICNEVDMAWEEYGFGIGLMAHVKRRMDFLAHKVIACSNAVRDYWDRNNSNKYAVIYLPIDMAKFTKQNISANGASFKNNDYPVMGMVSRIYPGKGHEYLLKAMPKIRQSIPNAKLKIVGTGPLMSELQSLSNSLNLNGAVEFTGFIEDLSAELSAMDLFILPSLTEGFPLSIMEAMATGLPVAATPVGGIPEMIEPGETGMLFPTKNPDALADAVVEILRDPENAKRMGQQGRQKAIKQYSPEIYIKQLDELYQELLTTKQHH
ncbi:MAG: glycosyltransferase family 4 protein [Anaerolineae bacterium]|nr:glycosyltransferase family 4 protein [Anaerolineae bacterium]